MKLKIGYLYKWLQEDDYVFYVTNIDSSGQHPMRSVDFSEGQQFINGWTKQIDDNSIEVLGLIEDYPEYLL